MERWRGRVALVTGATSGIGAAAVRELLKHGMKVAACGRNVAALQKIKEETTDSPGEFLPIKCDMRNESDIAAMFSLIKQTYGGVDVLINSAGLGYFQANLLEGTNEQWREMLEVNVLALAICSREAVKNMRERGVDDGHVINISSMSGHRLTDKSEHFYACTKHGVKVLTEGLRSELRELKNHIRVTSISPGNITTDFVERALATDEAGRKKYREQGSGIEEMTVDDITDSIIYALGAPPRVQVHDILIRPTEQVL